MGQHIILKPGTPPLKAQVLYINICWPSAPLHEVYSFEDQVFLQSSIKPVLPRPIAVLASSSRPKMKSRKHQNLVCQLISFYSLSSPLSHDDTVQCKLHNNAVIMGSFSSDYYTFCLPKLIYCIMLKIQASSGWAV